MSRPYICGFLKVRNEIIREGNLYRVLENMRQYCDRIVACDDASTDGTREHLLAVLPKDDVILVPPEKHQFHHELRWKQNGVYNISYSPSEDFPESPAISKSKEIILNGKDLKKAIDQTSFAMSKEDMRPAMTGTLFEFTTDGLKFVTTDGHRLVRLVYKNVQSGSEEQYIVPERAITVLSKLLGETDVKIYPGKSHISFIIGDVEFSSRLIAEKYPAYSSVIPLENENTLKIKRHELQSTIKSMMLFSSSNSKQVKFSIGKNNIVVSAEDIDLGSNAVEKISCDYSGEQMDIGFNTQYVNDILSHVDHDDVIFKLHSPTKRPRRNSGATSPAMGWMSRLLRLNRGTLPI